MNQVKEVEKMKVFRHKDQRLLTLMILYLTLVAFCGRTTFGSMSISMGRSNYNEANNRT